MGFVAAGLKRCPDSPPRQKAFASSLNKV
jgi:hypothetical protein